MKLTRRTLLIAAAAGLAAPLAWSSEDFVWRGYALGADAELRFSGIEKDRAAAAARAVMNEVERLENCFSLYRPNSELSRLNLDGVLRNPSHDFRLLTNLSLHYWEGTGGAFNPAVQPLWHFLSQHFAQSARPPAEKALRQVLPRCRAEHVDCSAGRIALAPGMALTFNGIAQGFITDRVAALIEAQGLHDVLVNMGELRAVKGKSWRVAVQGMTESIMLADSSVAQSSGAATPFSADRQWHHLLDPRSGHSANHLRAITVQAPTSTEADALSTALYVASPGHREAILNRHPAIRVLPQPPLDDGQGPAAANPVFSQPSERRTA